MMGSKPRVIRSRELAVGSRQKANGLWTMAYGLLILISTEVYCQSENQIKVKGEFLTDSIKIGKPFQYSLSARYPSDQTVLFPDSTFKYESFEYSSKTYFPTKTQNGISFDSVVYYFSSFEIDSVQALRLPVFVVHDKDCTSVFTETDLVWLQHQVTLSTDSIEATNLPLKVNTFYEPVSWLFNYPLASIIGGAVVIILIVCWIIFGKRIIIYFKIRRMTRVFEKYLQGFNTSIENLKSNYSIAQAEEVITIWKRYLENLEDRPFTKLTSKEILKTSGHEQLAPVLNAVDRLIYAGAMPTSFDAFYELKSHSEDCFYRKLQEIKHPVKATSTIESNQTPIIQNA